MKDYRIAEKVFQQCLSAAEVQSAIAREAQRIAEDFREKEPVFIVILKGAMFFAADLIRAVNIPCSVEVLSAKSYGNEMQSSGSVQLSEIASHIGGRHVIVVEDIVDSGLTLQSILQRLHEHAPASVSIATLLSKPTQHKVAIDVRYCCFEIGPEFLIGFGLDFAERGRELNAIYSLRDSSPAPEVR